MAHRYTDKEINFLRDNCKGKTTYEIAQIFNEYFGTNLTRSQIRSCMKNNKICSEIDRAKLKEFIPSIFTEEQKEFIQRNVKGRTAEELTDLLNTQFGTKFKASQIKNFKKNHSFRSEIDSKFKKGHIPPNKGIKGAGGWKPTQFKKGNRPVNYMPVGSERINGEGYVDVKVADPNKWKAKHIIIWEELHGPIPKGYRLMFGDGNRLNLEPNNLILVTNNQLLTMNRHGLIQNDADLTRTGLIIANLHLKISDRKRKAR